MVSAVPLSRFINLWETETDREQLVLLAHRPGTCKAEALAQPQHRLEALDRPPRRVEGLKAADPRHGPLDPEMVTLNPLLQVLGHAMHRGAGLRAPDREETAGLPQATLRGNVAVTGMSMGRKVESRWRLAGDELCETERSQPEARYEVWKRKGEVQLRPRGAGLPVEGTLR